MLEPNIQAAPPNRIPWPPILYGTAIIGGFVLNTFYPLAFLGGFIGEFFVMLGVLVVLGALFVDVMTFLELRKAKTTIMPHKASDHLVTSGPFKLSRNPIYVANTALCFGLGLIFTNSWLFIAGIVAAIATHHLAIKREEQHLEAKFGSAWRNYRKQTRRWL